MERPNILIFMTDQQRGDTTPPYSRALTPNLDKFCTEGVTFSQAYTIAPHCCPSRATFYSGLYPSQHGVWNNVNVGNTLSRGLYEDVRLWSEDLKEAGYDMYFSGKWHVSDVESPLDRGFDVMNIPKPVEKTVIKHEKPHTKEWASYLDYQPQIERDNAQIIRKGYKTYTHFGEKENPFQDGTVVDDAVKIIRNREKSGKPWCQFVGTLGPHDPYFVPQEYLDMYNIDDIEVPDSFEDSMQDKPALYRRTRERFDQLTEREHREAIMHYLAFCTYEDALFGRVLEALEESEDVENTVVLYISDHGDYVADHGLWCKGLPCFRGAYHIPVAVRWPVGIKNPGRKVNDFITLADFAPTFLELTKTEAGRDFTGMSLAPFLEDRIPDKWRDAVFTQTNGNELYGIQRSVMTRDWKLVYNGFDYDELYDLRKDPDEMYNLINDPGYDDVIHRLYKRLWAFARSVDDVCINQYIMVGLASYGPGVIFEPDVR
jgi:arylsulfatase A-like enzyme